MTGEKEFIKIYEYIKAHSNFDKFDMIIESFDQKLTRFANSVIHQNVAEKNIDILLRGVKNGKVGIASINSTEPEKLDFLIKNIETIISLKKENEEAEIIEKWEELPRYDQFWNKSTAEFTPEQMAKSVDILLKKAKNNSIDAFGAFEVNLSELFIANSFGLKRYSPRTVAGINLTAMGDKYTYAGLALDRNCDVSKINFDKIGQEACDICLKAKNPVSIEPGHYDVILSRQAVANLIEFMGYLGFSAKSYQENRSFLCGKLGSKICGENITIWDDGLDIKGLPMPFDFEGVKKEKVMLVENGIAKNLVYDTKTAKKEGRKSTGHALPAHSTSGPMPMNIFVKGGCHTTEEMIASTKKGLYVTSFHYVNVVDPRETIITGMTRNGTFLIENGKITKPVKNLRFTQNICEALSNVEMMSESKLNGEMGGAIVVPEMKIKNFHFTSKTDF
ncbi:MAG: TldD/PmbA family protein [Candidatus Wallbacteria bacterium]